MRPPFREILAVRRATTPDGAVEVPPHPAVAMSNILSEMAAGTTPRRRRGADQ